MALLPCVMVVVVAEVGGAHVHFYSVLGTSRAGHLIWIDSFSGCFLFSVFWTDSFSYHSSVD